MSRPAPQRVSIQYIAGLFDGEGCITIAQTGRGFRAHQVRCTIGIAHEGIIKAIVKMYGGYIKERKPKQDGYHTLWYWEVNSDSAIRFIRSVLPYLVVKRSQADMALEFHHDCVDPKSPKVKLLRKLRGGHTGRRLTTDEIEIREEYRLALQQEKKPKIISS